MYIIHCTRCKNGDLTVSECSRPTMSDCLLYRWYIEIKKSKIILFKEKKSLITFVSITNSNGCGTHTKLLEFSAIQKPVDTDSVKAKIIARIFRPGRGRMFNERRDMCSLNVSFAQRHSCPGCNLLVEPFAICLIFKRIFKKVCIGNEQVKNGVKQMCFHVLLEGQTQRIK